MFDQSLDLSDVLARLKRADESLAEFIAPLWPGVSLAAAWIEGKPRLFHLDGVPTEEGYYLLEIADDDTARVLHPADDDEARRYRGYLTKIHVIILDGGLAFPASTVERLQGITGPRPLHFADAQPLATVQARYDGLNLLFDGGEAAKKELSPLEALFADAEFFTPGEMLGIPGTLEAGGSAEEALRELQAHPEEMIAWRLRAVLETAGAVLEDWRREGDGYRVTWRREEETHTTVLAHAAAPITSGISLAGARAFDPATLLHLLHEHILDAWRG